MRIFGTSIPKSGTHVLQRTFARLNFTDLAIRKTRPEDFLTRERLSSLPDAENLYVFGHWRADERTVDAVLNAGLKPIVLIRDPRDICLSMADFLLTGRPEKVHRNEPALRQRPLRDLIIGSIAGFNLPGYTTRSIRHRFEGWLEWERHGAVLLRFEDFEGAVRTQTPIGAIARVGIDPGEFLQALSQVFRNPAQSKQDKGKTARWVTEFDDEIRHLWDREADGLAARFGYQTGM